MILVQAAFEREARNIGTFLAAEFLFFDGEEDGLIVDEGDRTAAADGGDREDVHELRRGAWPFP